MTEEIRTTWQAAASVPGSQVPPLASVISEARDKLDETLAAEPIHYDPEELAIRIAFNLREA